MKHRVLPYARSDAGSKRRWPMSVYVTVVFVALLVVYVFFAFLPMEGYFPTDHRRRHPVVWTQAELQRASSAINAFANDTGRVPTASEGLAVLLATPAQITASSGPYIIGPLNDAWGHPLIYQQLSPKSCRIISAGPDGKVGSADDLIQDVDIQ